MSIVFIRTVIIYILVIIAVRIMGKRQIGELQPSELVITILVSNIATLPLEDLNIPIIMGILPVLSLVCFEVIISWITMRSKRFRRLISGTPKVIIRSGTLDTDVMRELRFSVDDLMAALRGSNVFDIDDVQYAVVETNGSVSVYEKFPKRNTVNEDLKLKGESIDPPVIVISDGIVMERALGCIGLDRKWLKNVLSCRSLDVKDVFLLLADSDGKFTLIRKGTAHGTD